MASTDRSSTRSVEKMRGLVRPTSPRLVLGRERALGAQGAAAAEEVAFAQAGPDAQAVVGAEAGLEPDLEAGQLHQLPHQRSPGGRREARSAGARSRTGRWSRGSGRTGAPARRPKGRLISTSISSRRVLPRVERRGGSPSSRSSPSAAGGRQGLEAHLGDRHVLAAVQIHRELDLAAGSAHLGDLRPRLGVAARAQGPPRAATGPSPPAAGCRACPAPWPPGAAGPRRTPAGPAQARPAPRAPPPARSRARPRRAGESASPAARRS